MIMYFSDIIKHIDINVLFQGELEGTHYIEKISLPKRVQK